MLKLSRWGIAGIGDTAITGVIATIGGIVTGDTGIAIIGVRGSDSIFEAYPGTSRAGASLKSASRCPPQARATDLLGQ